MGPLARKFIDEVVEECDITEAAPRAAAFKILRAIGIDLMHKQAYTMAKLIEELRSEQQPSLESLREHVRARTAATDCDDDCVELLPHR